MNAKTGQGQIRRTAYRLWRGPDFVTTDDTNYYGGPCVLRLALRKGTSMAPQIEARAEYASLRDETQPEAIVRGSCWKSQAEALDSSAHSEPLKIPTKWIRLPIARAQQWIHAFDGLQTSFQIFPQQDDSLPICTLCIKTDPVCCMYEHVWQVVPGKQSPLLAVWNDIWHQMGETLQATPASTDLHEVFPGVDGPLVDYVYQAYEPLLTLF